MKKIPLLILTTIFLVSCGDSKKKESTEQDKPKEKYTLLMDAIYPKDDSIVVFYQKNTYFQYDNTISLKIKGSESLQSFVIDIPEYEKIENIKFIASTNNKQDNITVKNISVKKSNNFIDGSAGKFTKYFLSCVSFSWDTKNSRYILKHTNKYPPTFVGSEDLIKELTKF